MDILNVANRAQDPKAGMTVGELYQFAQTCLEHNIDPRTPVKITNGWRQQIVTVRTNNENKETA